MGFSVFTEVLMEKLGLSRVALSTAYCVGTVASGLTLPALGRLLDHWGARRMVVASALVTGAVLFYLSQVARITAGVASVLPDAWRMGVAFAAICLGFYLIRASAQGVLTMTCRNAMGKWFDVRRGLAVSISGLAISFGFSVAPKLLDELIKRFEYDGAWLLLGILSIAVMAPFGWLILRDNPEEAGLQMDGPNPPIPKKENPDMRIVREYPRRDALRTYSFWVFNLSFSFFALYSTAFTFHIVSLGKEFGFSKDFIITLFVPMATVSVGTNLVFGAINARTRLKFLLFLMNLGAVVGAIGLLYLNSPIGVPAYVAGNGICGGAFSCLTSIVWPRFFGRRWLGAIAGVGMSSMVIASGLGPIMFGAAAQVTGSYHFILLVSVSVPAVLAVLSLWADNPQRTLQAPE